MSLSAQQLLLSCAGLLLTAYAVYVDYRLQEDSDYEVSVRRAAC